jgi:hypothetical protein
MPRFVLDLGRFGAAVSRKFARNPMEIFPNLPLFLSTDCIFLACRPATKFGTEIEKAISNKKYRRPRRGPR